MPAPYEEYQRESKTLPETMFIRRHGMENVLRKLVLSSTKGGSNIHTIAGTVRSLERSSNGSRISAVVIRKPDGAELTINDPALAIGKSIFPFLI